MPEGSELTNTRIFIWEDWKELKTEYFSINGTVIAERTTPNE